MKRLGLALALLASLSLAAVAQVGGLSFPGPGPRVASVTFTGPGDLTLAGTFTQWGGFSCFKASAPTAKAIRLINETTTTQADINCNTSTGIDLTAVSTLGCGSAVCKVVTLYDQTGALGCAAGTACDLTQSTDADRPTYAATGGAGGKPCMTFGTSVVLTNAVGLSSSAQPFSIYAVAERNPTSTSLQGLYSTGSSFTGMYFASASNALSIFDGGFGAANASQTDAAFHYLAAVLNAASSLMNVDGASTASATTGGNPFGAGLPILLGSNSGDLIGAVCEVGFLDVSLTSGNQTSLSSNAHTRYGF